MIIKQLSIFLQNKIGRFTEVTNILGQAGVDMQAFTVSENSDFGILRLIVDDTDKAVAALREAGFAVNTTDVVCLVCPDKPGAIAPYMNRLSEGGISIEYMYAFSQLGSAKVIIRPDNIELCEKLISE